MMENKIVKRLMLVTLPGITDMKKIYITRQYPEITLDVLLDEINNKNMDKIAPFKDWRPKRESSTIF